MDASGVFTGLLTTVIGGSFVAWLFAPADVLGGAVRRLRIMGSILYRSLALLGALAMLISSANEFYKFAYSEAPIQRMEVIGLFFYMLNFFVYLVATIAVTAIWAKGEGSNRSERP
ncbi:hypothetical protein [Pseudomonas extremorientalis]|uniref:hypothetical protein n=1 Tax=Pseudomonas extremorientalis TaxID=169669 RepID=UPI00211BD600|nr:hypothetical protein [Pseudomonas extremorientalis]UUN86550.1 hypothetical protein LUU92_16920 [Pseudomonas extremorientalis]